MLVYIKVGLETPTHTLLKNNTYDLKSDEAKKLLSLKIARLPTKKEIEKHDS